MREERRRAVKVRAVSSSPSSDAARPAADSGGAAADEASRRENGREPLANSTRSLCAPDGVYLSSQILDDTLFSVARQNL